MRLILTTILLGLTILASVSSFAIQICNDHILKSKPDTIYKNNANGTVTDTKTHLNWQICSYGQVYNAGTCTGKVIDLTWDEALKQVQTANKAKELGYSDWRVPNKNEMSSLVEFACGSPSINENIFPAVSYNAVFWTSSPYIGNSSYAWSVGFYNGSGGYYYKPNQFKPSLS